MNIIDLIIVFFILIFCIKGYLKGFLHELFSLLILILGLAVSFLFYKTLSSFFVEFIKNRDLSLIVSFLLIFITITILLITVRNAIQNVVDSYNFTEIDYVLGVIIGFVKGFLIIGTILVFLKNRRVFIIERTIDGSSLYPVVERIITGIVSIISDRFRLLVDRISGLF